MSSKFKINLCLSYIEFCLWNGSNILAGGMSGWDNGNDWLFYFNRKESHWLSFHAFVCNSVYVFPNDFNKSSFHLGTAQKWISKSSLKISLLSCSVRRMVQWISFHPFFTLKFNLFSSGCFLLILFFGLKPTNRSLKNLNNMVKEQEIKNALQNALQR